jgi:hypothetical protein
MGAQAAAAPAAATSPTQRIDARRCFGDEFPLRIMKSFPGRCEGRRRARSAGLPLLI